jgi:ABC-2 type transport system ATP-binding protein
MALEGVDLEVAQGERIGFLGPNGAGTTTFIRCALGILRPTEGSVAILGHDLATDRMAALAQVGYVPGDLGMIRAVSGRRMLDSLARLHPRPRPRSLRARLPPRSLPPRPKQRLRRTSAPRAVNSLHSTRPVASTASRLASG